MYAGFITTKRVVKRAGIHQRFDMAAFRMIEDFIPDGSFPTIKQILHFEGYNGPDGLKSKVGLKYKTKDDGNPSHIYDPKSDTGEIPGYIEMHYAALVDKLQVNDMIRASFEAAWMAHYIADGMTPAHHFPLEEKIAAAADKATNDLRKGDATKFEAFLQKNWAIWGVKGHMTQHQNFELGVAFALLLFPIRPEFDEHELARARQLGPVEYFKSQARAVASIDLYEKFYESGWNADIASIVKNELAPKTAQTIGTVWLLAFLEAGQQLAKKAAAKAQIA
jgi:hypothetical protein